MEYDSNTGNDSDTNTNFVVEQHQTLTDVEHRIRALSAADQFGDGSNDVRVQPYELCGPSNDLLAYPAIETAPEDTLAYKYHTTILALRDSPEAAFYDLLTTASSDGQPASHIATITIDGVPGKPVPNIDLRYHADPDTRQTYFTVDDAGVNEDYKNTQRYRNYRNGIEQVLAAVGFEQGDDDTARFYRADEAAQSAVTEETPWMAADDD